MKLSFSDKNITIRKWKGKDKKKFVKALKEDKISESLVMNALVYDCIEEDVVLSTDEFKYVLSRIRAETLGEEIEIEFLCNECGEIETKKFLLKDILKTSYKKLTEITVGKIKITLGPIKNKEVYLKYLAEDEVYDFLLRVETFNGNDAFTLEELTDMIDDLDLGVVEEIYKQFDDAKFKIDDINTVICGKCKNEEIFEFDELPQFFPDEWFI